MKRTLQPALETHRDSQRLVIVRAYVTTTRQWNRVQESTYVLIEAWCLKVSFSIKANVHLRGALELLRALYIGRANAIVSQTYPLSWISPYATEWCRDVDGNVQARTSGPVQ